MIDREALLGGFKPEDYDMDLVEEYVDQYYEAAGFSGYHDKVTANKEPYATFESFTHLWDADGGESKEQSAADEEAFEEALAEVRKAD